MKKRNKQIKGAPPSIAPSSSCSSHGRAEVTARIVKALYANVEAFKISRERREDVADPTDKSLTYGEIIPKSFYQILGLTITGNDGAKRRKRRRFVDLGCGVGRAVFCAALFHTPFENCWGIEILSALVEEANNATDLFLQSLEQTTSSEPKTVSKRPNPANDRRQETNNESKDRHTTSLEEWYACIQKVFNNEGCNQMNMDLLANKVCLAMGHKKFRLALKEHKKFRFLLDKLSNVVVQENNEVTITRNLGGGDEVQEDTLVISGVPSGSTYHTGGRNNPKECSSVVEHDSEAFIDAETGKTEHTIMEKAFSRMNLKRTDSNFEGFDSQVEHIENGIVSAEHPRSVDVLVDLLQECRTRDALFPPPDIQFTAGSIFDIDWWTCGEEECVVAYAASLLFSEDMMKQLTEKTRLLSSGSWMISLKPLILDEGDARRIVLKHESFFKMSWQMAKVYVYYLPY